MTVETIESVEPSESIEPIELNECSENVLALVGELTIYTAAEMRTKLRAHLETHSLFVLDLSEVSEFDSAGLQLLLWARRTAAEHGLRFRLVGISHPVANVIALLQLEQVLNSCPTHPSTVTT